MANEITKLLRRDRKRDMDAKWNKNAVPGKPLKRKLPGTDEEEKLEKNKRYRPERKLNMKWQEGRSWEC
jgi:hypothetical protein